MRGLSIDAGVYMVPRPQAVARLVATHSLDAALERWHWLCERTVSQPGQIGRAQAGTAAGSRKRRGYSEADAAVAVEAGHVLGSARRGLRAAGIRTGTNPQALFGASGLTPPTISPDERERGVRAARAAKEGDSTERDARHAEEQAIGRVLRVALALVPAQPATDRYRLPPVDATLAAARASEDAAAVAAVFPDIAMEAR